MTSRATSPHPHGPATIGPGTAVAAARGLVWVEGPDAAGFLHGLLTCSVTDLHVGDGRLALLLDAKGHIVVQLQVLRDSADGFTLVTDPGAAAGLADDLARFHFSEDLEILGPEIAETLVVSDGAAAPSGGATVPGWVPGTLEMIVDDPAAAARDLGMTLAPAAVLEIARIRAGVVRVGSDTGPRTLVQEARLEDRVVDFTKGCYLGQETVARAQHRGRVTRVLRGLVATKALPPGATVTHAGREVGTITSTATLPEQAIAMGILRREVPDGATVEVGPQAIPATIAPFPLP